MILMPDQYNARAIARESYGLQVHFGDQWASGVDYVELAFLSLLADGWRDSMRAEDGAGLAQFVNDVFVVDDFLAHVDRRAVKIERNFHHVDSPYYARAKATRL